MAYIYEPLASVADMQDGPYSYALRGATENYVKSTMVRASRRIESICGRRFVPYVDAVHTERAEGVPPDGDGVGLPVSTVGALQMSLARAYGAAGQMVRDVWLADYAPVAAHLWTYSNVTALVTAPVGGAQSTGIYEGPHPDTGHLRLPLGIYCPVGSTIEIRHSGGYTLGYPDDLVQASMLQAVKLFILGLAPERRGSLSTADLDNELVSLLVPFGAPDPRRQIRRGRGKG